MFWARMSEPSYYHTYLCGFNGFQQIDKATADGVEHDADSCRPVPVLLTHSQVTDTPTKIRFNWAQIWIWNESGQVDVFGINQEDINQTLAKENLNPNSVVFYENNCIIQKTRRGTITLLAEDASTKSIGCNTEKVDVVGAMGSQIVVLKDGQPSIGSISTSEENPVLLMTGLDLDRKVTTVACGFDHTLMLTDNGQVYSIGSSSRGQLGHGETSVDIVCTPTLIQALHGLHMVTIATGGWHSSAISDSGDLYVWGWNEAGQLGLPNGSTDTRSHDTPCDPDDRDKSWACDNDSSMSYDLDRSCDQDSNIRYRSCDQDTTLEDGSCDQNRNNKDRSSDQDRNLEDGSCYHNRNSKDRSCDQESALEDGSCDHDMSSKDKSCDIDSGSKNRSCERSCDPDQHVMSHDQSIPISLAQNVDPVLIQSVPYGLDIPDNVAVKSVACGSRHTCVLFESGYLMTTGWNKYGQLGHGHTVSTDRLTTVMSPVHRREKVINVFADQWNTAIVTKSDELNCSRDVT